MKCNSIFNGQNYEIEINFEKVDGGFDITFGDPSWNLKLVLRGIEVFKFKNILKLWITMNPYNTTFNNVVVNNMVFTFNGQVNINIQDIIDYGIMVDILDSFKLNLDSIALASTPSITPEAAAQIINQQQPQNGVAQNPVQQEVQQTIVQHAQVANQTVQQPQQVAVQQAPQQGAEQLSMPQLPYDLPSGQPAMVQIPNQVVRLDATQPEQNVMPNIDTPPFLVKQ